MRGPGAPLPSAPSSAPGVFAILAAAGLSRTAVLRWQGGAAAFFLAVYLGLVEASRTWHGAVVMKVFRLFDLDGEANLPAAFQGFTLLGSALLILVAAQGETRHAVRRRWQLLGLAFVFLAFDEIASLHERCGELWLALTGGPKVFGAWLVPVLPIATVIVVVGFLPLVWQAPRRTGLGLVAAGAVYVGGAVGCEMVGAWIVHTVGRDSLAYLYEVAVEEGMEMLGIVLLVQVLLRHLHEESLRVRFPARR